MKNETVETKRSSRKETCMEKIHKSKSVLFVHQACHASLNIHARPQKKQGVHSDVPLNSTVASV